MHTDECLFIPSKSDLSQFTLFSIYQDANGGKFVKRPIGDQEGLTAKHIAFRILLSGKLKSANCPLTLAISKA